MSQPVVVGHGIKKWWNLSHRVVVSHVAHAAT